MSLHYEKDPGASEKSVLIRFLNEIMGLEAYKCICDSFTTTFSRGPCTFHYNIFKVGTSYTRLLHSWFNSQAVFSVQFELPQG